MIIHFKFVEILISFLNIHSYKKIYNNAKNKKNDKIITKDYCQLRLKLKTITFTKYQSITTKSNLDSSTINNEEKDNKKVSIHKNNIKQNT